MQGLRILSSTSFAISRVSSTFWKYIYVKKKNLKKGAKFKCIFTSSAALFSSLRPRYQPFTRHKWRKSATFKTIKYFATFNFTILNLPPSKPSTNLPQKYSKVYYVEVYHLKVYKCIESKCIVSPAAARASRPHSVQETSKLGQKMPPEKNDVKNAPWTNYVKNAPKLIISAWISIICVIKTWTRVMSVSEKNAESLTYFQNCGWMLVCWRTSSTLAKKILSWVVRLASGSTFLDIFLKYSLIYIENDSVSDIK